MDLTACVRKRPDLNLRIVTERDPLIDEKAIIVSLIC
jgi:hypothetical protein